MNFAPNGPQIECSTLPETARDSARKIGNGRKRDQAGVRVVGLCHPKHRRPRQRCLITQPELIQLVQIVVMSFDNMRVPLSEWTPMSVGNDMLAATDSSM
jgi:hypothetical protein